MRASFLLLLLCTWAAAGCREAPPSPVVMDAEAPLDAGSPNPDAASSDASSDAASDRQDAAIDASSPELPRCTCDRSVQLQGPCTRPCAAAFEALFSERAFPTFYLTIPDDNGPAGESSWERLEACTRDEASSMTPPSHCRYQLGSFHAVYDPDPNDDVAELLTSPEIPVGIRLKGRASFRSLDDKPALKVKFTAFGGERFLGLSGLTLNNLVQDPSGLRERLAYQIFRNAGVTASLANSARLFVRRNETSEYEYYGVYANVQTLDRRFLEYHFGDVAGQVGNLYDTYNHVYFTDLDRSEDRDQEGLAPGAQEARFQLETNEAKNDKSDLTALLDAIYSPDPKVGNEHFVQDVEAVLDLDAVLTTLSVQALIADWDGFAGARNNYKVYRELARGRFVLLPWGTDQTFGTEEAAYQPNWNYRLDHGTSNRVRAYFLLRCIEDAAECYPRYRARARDVLDGFDAITLLAQIDTWAQQIREAMLADPKKPWSAEDFEAHVGYLEHFIENRDACLRGQLTASPLEDVPDCPL